MFFRVFLTTTGYKQKLYVTKFEKNYCSYSQTLYRVFIFVNSGRRDI